MQSESCLKACGFCTDEKGQVLNVQMITWTNLLSKLRLESYLLNTTSFVPLEKLAPVSQSLR